MTDNSYTEYRCRIAADEVVKNFTELKEYIASYGDEKMTEAVSKSQLHVTMHKAGNVTKDITQYIAFATGEDQSVSCDNSVSIRNALFELCTSDTKYTHLSIDYYVNGYCFRFIRVNTGVYVELFNIIRLFDLDVLAHSVMEYLTGKSSYYIPWRDVEQLVESAVRSTLVQEKPVHFCINLNHVNGVYTFTSKELTCDNAKDQLCNVLRLVESKIAATGQVINDVSIGVKVDDENVDSRAFIPNSMLVPRTRR